MNMRVPIKNHFADQKIRFPKNRFQRRLYSRVYSDSVGNKLVSINFFKKSIQRAKIKGPVNLSVDVFVKIKSKSK